MASKRTASKRTASNRTPGFEIDPADQQTPEAPGTYQKAEIDQWWPIFRAGNIKGE